MRGVLQAPFGQQTLLLKAVMIVLGRLLSGAAY